MSLLPHEKLELAIYRAMESGGKRDGFSGSIRDLAKAVANSDQARLVETLKWLGERTLVTLEKYSPVPMMMGFNLYTGTGDRDFFYRGDFRVKVTPKGRPYFESLEQKEETEREQAERAGKPLVFISCGQCSPEELKLGDDVKRLVEERTDCEAYLAENQNSAEGLSQNILKALDRCVAFIAIMHHRGEVSTPEGTHIRGSVWIEQEIAITAFLVQAQQKDLKVQVYFRKGIKREGIRNQLNLARTEFKTSSDLLDDLRSRIESGQFEVGTPKVSARTDG